MRRILLVILVVVGALTTAGVASASHDPSGAPFNEDFVVGSGSTANFDAARIELDAHSDPGGATPRGEVSFSVFGSIAVGGPITCLSVTDNRAVLVFRDVGPFTFGHIGVEVADGPASTDEFFFSNPGVPPTDCAASTFREFGGPASSFVVHEASPFPTTKDQCKNGGWRNFPGFKNQGQCVSFVATGGKKQR